MERNNDDFEIEDEYDDFDDFDEEGMDDMPMMSDLQYKEYCRVMGVLKAKNGYIKYLQTLLRDAGIEYFEISID